MAVSDRISATVAPRSGGICRRAGRFVSGLLFFFVFVLSACTVEDASRRQDDLALAEAALRERDTGDAEMYFERYLRKNADGTQRWEVWQKLLAIALNARQDKVTASEYLEIMLAEFAGDPPKRRRIQMQLAELYNEMHAYDRAVALWEALAADSGTPPEERAVVYRQLSHAYLRRLEFTTATEVLDLCLQLEVQPDTKADCFYALAETQMLTEELPASEKALRDLLQLEGVAEERRVAAVFMLADVLEQQERLDEAVELLESIRESYPNARVVALRINAIKDKKNGKRDVVVPVKKR